MKKGMLLSLICTGTLIFISLSSNAQCEKKETAIKWLQSKTDFFSGDKVNISTYDITVRSTEEGFENLYFDLAWADITFAQIKPRGSRDPNCACIELFANKYLRRTSNFTHAFIDGRAHYEILVSISGDSNMAARVLSAIHDILACNKANEPY